MWLWSRRPSHLRFPSLKVNQEIKLGAKLFAYMLMLLASKYGFPLCNPSMASQVGL